jgi:hypothetical protein
MHRSPSHPPQQLFVLSVLLSCTMRCLSFIAIGSLDFQCAFATANDDFRAGGSEGIKPDDLADMT